MDGKEMMSKGQAEHRLVSGMQRDRDWSDEKSGCCKVPGMNFAKMQGLSTLRSGVYSLYKNEIPLFEIISGASIALAACLLIIPGFVTDALGFLLLFPWTRKIIVKSFIKKQNNVKTEAQNYIDGEVIEKNNKEKKDDL